MARTNARKPSLVLEIARRANVSRAAAYAVLNATGPSTIGVSEEKRQRVLAAARETGYVRNELARALSVGRTFTIGVLVHSLKNHFFTDFFMHLDDACYRANYSASFANSEFDADREARHLRAFLAKKVDALVIVRDPRHQNDELLQQFTERNIPIITVGEIVGAELTYSNVTYDESLGQKLAASHLWQMGHRRVLYFSIHRSSDSISLVHDYREKRFADAWASASGNTPFEIFHADNPIHAAEELAEHLMKRSPADRPTVIACANDRLALNALSALRVASIRVPDDISILGYDDIDAAAECAVPLTTVRLPTEKLADAVWTLLQKRLATPSLNTPECITLSPELVQRQSVRPIDTNNT